MDDNLQKFPLLTHQNISQFEEAYEEKKLIFPHECKYLWNNENCAEPNMIRLLVVTWNMQGKIPQISLKNLFQTQNILHHLIVVGTQECQRSIGLSLFCDSKEDWEMKLQFELGKEYQKIEGEYLNAMHICIFAHQSIIPLIRKGKTFQMPLGLWNIVGNKGAVGIWIKVGKKKFFFLNTHLASGQNNQQARKQQFTKMETENQISKNNMNQQKISDLFEYVIYMGDYNSRINLNFNEKDVHQQLYYECLKKDQKLNENYGDFKEGMIRFPPTYKYEVSKNQLSRGKNWRIPGWTDRIMFKQNDSSKTKYIDEMEMKERKIKINQVMNEEQIMTDTGTKGDLRLWNYDSNFDIFGSDHRPVYAQFSAII